MAGITITEQISVCDGRGAQVVGIDGNRVAKIYDSLYYPDPTDNKYCNLTPCGYADREYTHETAAYERLSPALGGREIPIYHGSFTFDLPILDTKSTQTRPVRLILLEHLHGVCMQHIKHPLKTYPQIQQKEIMRKLVETHCAILSKRVAHGDIHPRNIIICQNKPGEPEFRVAFVDFGFSRLTDRLNNPNYALSLGGLPVSPILVWDHRNSNLCDFQKQEWIGWDWQS